MARASGGGCAADARSSLPVFLPAWLLISVAFVQAPAPPEQTPPSSPAQTPAAPADPGAQPAQENAAAGPADPAASTFATGVGMLLVPVKADKAADYEAVMTALQAAFAQSNDPARRAVAEGWRVFKAADAQRTARK